MRIIGVQSQQSSFGTTVRMSSSVARMYEKSQLTDTILKQIKQLENNGINDNLIINDNELMNGLLRATLTQLHKEAGEKPYMTKVREFLALEEDLTEFYERISNKTIRLKPKQIKIPENLFSYII